MDDAADAHVRYEIRVHFSFLCGWSATGIIIKRRYPWTVGHLVMDDVTESQLQSRYHIRSLLTGWQAAGVIIAGWYY